MENMDISESESELSEESIELPSPLSLSSSVSLEELFLAGLAQDEATIPIPFPIKEKCNNDPQPSTSTAKEVHNSSEVAMRGKRTTDVDVVIVENPQSQSTNTAEITVPPISTEELVMKRRLIIDGSNNEVRLTTLTKNFVSYCKSTDESTRDSKVSLTRLMTQVRRIKFDAKKNYVEILKTEESKGTLDSVQIALREEIVKTHKIATDTHGTLAEYRRFQSSRRQSEAIGRILAELPDQATLAARLHQSNQELAMLQEKYKKQQAFLESRTGAFSTLAGVVDILQEIIEDDEECGAEIAENSKNASVEIEKSGPPICTNSPHDDCAAMGESCELCEYIALDTSCCDSGKVCYESQIDPTSTFISC